MTPDEVSYWMATDPIMCIRMSLALREELGRPVQCIHMVRKLYEQILKANGDRYGNVVQDMRNGKFDNCSFAVHTTKEASEAAAHMDCMVFHKNAISLEGSMFNVDENGNVTTADNMPGEWKETIKERIHRKGENN